MNHSKRHFMKGMLAGSVAAALSHPVTWAADKKELVFLTEEGTPTFRAFWDEAARDFKAQTGVGVRVEYLAIDMGLNRRLAMLLQAGTPPDLTQGYMGSDVYTLLAHDLLEPVSEELSYLENQVGEKVNDNFRVQSDGQDYLVPLWCSGGNMWYRRDLFEKAGVTEAPEKWDAFLDAIERVNSKEVGGTTVGGGKSWCTNSDFLSLVWGNDARVTARDGAGELSIVVDSPENIDRVVEALLFWKKASAFSIPAKDYGCGNLIEAIYSGNAASAPYVGARQRVESARKEQPFAKDVMPMQFPWNRTPVSMGSFEGLCVFRQSPMKQEAKAFIDFLMTGDRYYRMMQCDPLHNMPPFAKAAVSDKMMDSPFIQQNLDREVFAKVSEVIGRSRVFANEVAPQNLYVGPLYGSLEMATTVYNVVYGNADPHAEVQRLGNALRTILKQQQV